MLYYLMFRANKVNKPWGISTVGSALQSHCREMCIRDSGNLGGEGVVEKISALALPIFLAALAVNVASMFVAAKMFDRRAEE